MGEAVAEVGQTANKYEILARLATGGMAEIFLARGVSATGVERYCVLKRILRNRASDVSFVRMFLDEARLAAQLQHPNVAQVYDIGKLGDSYFFTMEYVHGETVRAIMQRARSLRRELPLSSVLTIVAGAAAGLHHAHDRIGIDGRALNIVHRDVSPSNLMVSYEGNVKVVDFGVAKASDRANETMSGTVKGKISYLSPEQARGSSSIDRRSDLFALGIVMWEMLTTERLYKRSSDFENMSAIVNEPPPPPSSRKSSVPKELDAITMRLLAKDPGERFQTADEVIEALEGFASRNATMISPSSLARFLRDMFGQRPEPWVEMDTADAPEGVTVTSEPIPGELAIPVDANDDLSLDQVPKLEKPVPQIDDDHLPTPFIGVSTAEPDQIPTRPHAKLDPLISTFSDASPPPPTPAPVRVMAAQTMAGIGGSGAHARIPGSGQQARINPTPQGGNRPDLSTGSAPAYPRPVPGDRLPEEEDAPSKGVGWQLVSVIMIAAIVGSLTMFLVMRGGSGNETTAANAPVVVADAALAVAADAAPVAVVEVDAAPAVVEVDAPVAVVDTVAADAQAAAPPPAEPPPEVVAEEPKPVEKKKPAKSAIETAFDAGNFKDVVSRCAKSFPNNADDVRCALAACKSKNESKARSFVAKIEKSKRKSVVSACRNNDVDLEDRKPDKPADKPTDKPADKKDCDADPMSCQH